jgi:hypothetical protein
MKKISHFMIVTLLTLGSAMEGFSQACGVSATELITDGSFESGGYTAFTSPVSGGCKEVTNNAQHTGPGCGYSAFQTTANTAQNGSYAFLYDGGSAAGPLLCQVINIDRAKTYDISAYYKSAANPTASIGNVSNLRITIDVGSGPVAIGSGWAPISNQTTYDKNECFYKAGGSGTVAATVCIEFQPTINTGGGASYTSGNDALIDNFSVREIPSPSGGCAAGTCTYPVTTPVKLVSFAARRSDENKVSLQWTSASEENFSYYSVQKSYDAISFWETGQVAAKGSLIGVTNYEFKDNRFDESCYYRLKMIDKDGKFEYSVLSFVHKESDYVWIVNTGSAEDLKIKAMVKKNTTWNISCYSMLSQELYSEKVSISEGENNIPLNNSAMIDRNPKILRILDEDGKVILSQLIYLIR